MPYKILISVKYTVLLPVLLIAVAVSLLAAATQAQAAGNERIAFVSDRGGNKEIYIMGSDGSNQIRLTDDPGSDTFPAFSPDGATIAFSSNRAGNNEIYVMNTNGSGLRRLTDRPTFTDTQPAWSPDGTKIAFMSAEFDILAEVYVMNADGSGLRRLTGNPGYDQLPDWSPDGTKIAFSSAQDLNDEIYVMNADGSGQTNLTNYWNTDINPDWSPDGSKIAFITIRNSNYEIYTMNPSGGGLVNLTNMRFASEGSAEWSPDGTEIAFSAVHEGNREIFVMSDDGSGARNISNAPNSSDSMLSWQRILPDCSQVLVCNPDRPACSVGPNEFAILRADFDTPESHTVGDPSKLTGEFVACGTEIRAASTYLEAGSGTLNERFDIEMPPGVGLETNPTPPEGTYVGFLQLDVHTWRGDSQTPAFIPRVPLYLRVAAQGSGQCPGGELICMRGDTWQGSPLNGYLHGWIREVGGRLTLTIGEFQSRDYPSSPAGASKVILNICGYRGTTSEDEPYCGRNTAPSLLRNGSYSAPDCNGGQGPNGIYKVTATNRSGDTTSDTQGSRDCVPWTLGLRPIDPGKIQPLPPGGRCLTCAVRPGRR